MRHTEKFKCEICSLEYAVELLYVDLVQTKSTRSSGKYTLTSCKVCKLTQQVTELKSELTDLKNAENENTLSLTHAPIMDNASNMNAETLEGLLNDHKAIVSGEISPLKNSVSEIRNLLKTLQESVDAEGAQKSSLTHAPNMDNASNINVETFEP